MALSNIEVKETIGYGEIIYIECAADIPHKIACYITDGQGKQGDPRDTALWNPFL